MAIPRKFQSDKTNALLVLQEYNSLVYMEEKKLASLALESSSLNPAKQIDKTSEIIFIKNCLE